MKPRFDTWKRKKYAGAWTIVVDVDGAPNAWLAEATSRALAAFAALGEPTKVEILTEDPGKPIHLEAAPNRSGAPFVQDVQRTLHNARIELRSVDVTLELHVKARTAASNGALTLAKLPDGAKIALTFDQDDDCGRIDVTIDHTLFVADAPDGHDNRAIAEANGPRLTDALKKLEAAFGAIEDFEGLPGIHAHGYTL